jgi:uncharacterized Zn finger protein
MASYFEWTDIRCPYCGRLAELSIDTTGDLPEDMVEDCPSCCRPWQVHVVTHGDSVADVVVSRLVED